MDIKDIGNIAVLYGGDSAEREISLKSGQAILESLQKSGVKAFAVNINKNMLTAIQQLACDRAFIALHGRGGEDGIVQAILQAANIPYTGSGVLASALGMDKMRCKQLWRSLDIPTPTFYHPQSIEHLEFPVIVKPSHEGSSVGISIAKSKADLAASIQLAKQYDTEILIEKWIAGREYTVAILGKQALPVIELETPREFYDYQAKYKVDSTTYHCPANLSKEITENLQALAYETFLSIGGQTWGRVDFMLDEAQQPWVIEVNTVPGMTAHSLVPMAAAQKGITFDDLVIKIITDKAEK